MEIGPRMDESARLKERRPEEGSRREEENKSGVGPCGG